MSQMSQLGTGYMLGCDLLKTNLDGLIAVMGSRFNLGHDAGAGFYYGHRNDGSIWPEHLGHADLSAQQCIEHILSSLHCRGGSSALLPLLPRRDNSPDVLTRRFLRFDNKGFCYSLTSMSTPAGRFKRVSASTVLFVGSMISIKRLCVRISNCSRASLSTKGDRITVYLSISVGKGTGPETRAPVCCAVFTICIADWSRIRWSYALSRMRMRCFVPVAIFYSPDIGSKALLAASIACNHSQGGD